MQRQREIDLDNGQSYQVTEERVWLESEQRHVWVAIASNKPRWECKEH